MGDKHDQCTYIKRETAKPRKSAANEEQRIDKTPVVALVRDNSLLNFMLNYPVLTYLCSITSNLDGA